MRHPIAVAVAAATVLVAAAGLLTWSAATGIGPAGEDSAALASAIDSRSGTLTSAAVAFTNLGSTLAMAILACVVGAVLWVRGRRADGIWLVGVMLGASALFTLVKRVFDRARPPQADWLVQVTNESLPSGHATMSAAVIGALVVLAWPALTLVWRAATVAGATLWVAGIGLTRVYLGVHWFSDVVAGWAMGLAWLAVCTGLRLLWRSRTPVTGVSGPG